MPEPSAVGAAIADLKARTGMTYAQLADALGASGPDYVRKVAGGVKPGRNLDAAVRQLAERGRVTEPPTRRRSATGELARVRAAGVERSRVPAERDLRAYRGRFSSTTQLTAGGRGRIDTITAPRTEGLGRERARAAVADSVRSAQRADRRVSFVVEYANGQRVTLGGKGGYDPAMLMRRLRAGEEVLGWLADQGEGRYGAGGAVVEVQVVVT